MRFVVNLAGGPGKPLRSVEPDGRRCDERHVVEGDNTDIFFVRDSAALIDQGMKIVRHSSKQPWKRYDLKANPIGGARANQRSNLRHFTEGNEGNQGQEVEGALRSLRSPL